MIFARFRYILAILSLVLAFACSDHMEVTLPSDLPLGIPYNIKINTSSATINIPTVSSTEEFSLILYASPEKSPTHKTMIEGGVITESDKNVNPVGSDEKISPNPLDPFLRSAEADAALSAGISPLKKITPKILSYSPPQRKTFKVLDNINDPSSYTTIEADLISLSTNSAFYVDASISPTIKNDPSYLPSIIKLRTDFDSIIAPLDRQYFGMESQVDDLAPIIILMTPVVNRMTMDVPGNILGFFYSHDLFTDGRYPESNGTEIFYIAAFDEKLTPARNVSAYETITYCTNKIFHGTLAHEFQHMINFNQHVLVNNGNSEEDWLNEGLSHLAEDLTGYGWGNMALVNNFLADPSSYPLTGKQNAAGQRGASYLFSRYLFENFSSPDTQVTKLLASSPYRGIKNIERSLNTDFTQSFSDWLATLALSNSGIEARPKYSYKPPIIYPSESWIGPFQIGIDIRGINGDYNFRGPWFEDFNTISISLYSASSSFYNIKASDSGSIKIELTLGNNAGSGLIIIPTMK